MTDRNVGVTSGPAAESPSATVLCAGVNIALLSRSQACVEIVRYAASGPPRPMDVHLCNAYTLALAHKDPSYRELLNRAGMNLSDGMSVVWANRVLRRRQSSVDTHVRGTDLLLEVCDTGTPKRIRHYLLGSTPDVLESLVSNLRARYPEIQIVGSESPPFRELTEPERDEQRARIRESDAQLVWVGLGTPKQDLEAARLASELRLVFVAVGAAFDFVAGNKSEAPEWMQRSGVEWVYRLLSEPRRLWRRYLFGNARFLWALIRG
jgi:N-acetylglucosaminyldiphosphoundecaprenol N-acetyl-beta-D-mannosaminyltransferase